MSVAKRAVNGVQTWVIDRRFRTKDGREERYRRAAQVQIKAAALQEELDLIVEFKTKGTIAHLLGISQVAPESAQEAPEPAQPASSKKAYIWEDAVEHYRKNVLPHKKRSTQRNYEQVLGNVHTAHWQGWKLVDIDYTAIEAWELGLRKVLPHDGSRRCEHGVLRAILRAVGPNKDGKWLMLPKLPNFPSLPKSKDTKPPIPTDEEVAVLLNEGKAGGVSRTKWCRPLALERAQLAFALALYAGLRAGEIRALRKKDIDPATKLLTVARNRSFGVEDTTKGGDPRTLRITPVLWERLEPRLAELTDPNAYVCLCYEGGPWDGHGIYQAWTRTLKRLGIKPMKFHATRHYFLSSLFTFGASVITVKDSAGHKNVATTMRYAHFNQADQDRAIAQFSAK